MNKGHGGTIRGKSVSDLESFARIGKRNSQMRENRIMSRPYEIEHNPPKNAGGGAEELIDGCDNRPINREQTDFRGGVQTRPNPLDENGSGVLERTCSGYQAQRRFGMFIHRSVRGELAAERNGPNIPTRLPRAKSKAEHL